MGLKHTMTAKVSIALNRKGAIHMTISPYVLLKASIPKPAQTVTTTYDLYSLTNKSAVSDASFQHTPPTASIPLHADIPSSAKRTHYIADIHARHTDAMRQTRQQTTQL